MGTTIHIGLPKTGTTALQTQIFSQDSSIQYIGSYGAHDELFRFIVTAEELEYIKREPEIKQTFIPYTEGETPLLVSREESTISHYYPVWMSYADRFLIAHRYKRLFPDAKILFIIRHPIKFLASLFNQWQKHPYIYKHSFSHWIQWQIEAYNSEFGSWLKIPIYWEIYTLYAELFGAQNIKVMLYEEFEDHPTSFISDFMTFAGSNQKTFPSPTYENTATASNQIRREQLYWKYSHLRVPLAAYDKLTRAVSRLNPNTSQKHRSSLRLNENQTRFISDLYREGNRKLAQTAQLNLQAYNYPL